jgi:N-acetyl-anhydromuramyl-L-alanine amidase AmpD/V8-like Glu-specific endopeptidase
MAVIRANRESIDDRFSVLGFTVRSELPLFEIAIATDPELLRPALRAKRTPGNFHTSRLLRASPSQRGEAVYLVPPDVVARFVGQPRLYFGLATYRESDRSTPVSMRMPDRGTMYVSLSGLTERGLRRTVRSRSATTNGSTGYGGNGTELGWGGDAAGATLPPSRDEDRAAAPKAKMTSGAGEPATYSDGYSEELWKQPAPVAAAPAPALAPALTTAPSPSATAQSLAMRNGSGRRPMATSRSLLISSDYHPSNFWDALRAQAGFFLDSAMWYLGVANTRVMPHSAICQIRVPDGTAEGGLHGSGFFIGPRLIMTAAHVVDGQTELIVVPGKNGGGTGSATEPFGRFKVAQFRKHDSYGTNGSDYDMGLICVPAANAVGKGQYFDLVEELNQSRPEGVVVSGYAARWYANDLIEHFVNDNIDPNRQHMMGGYIRDLPTDETFSYNIQTLGGTSGSPVYWIEETGAGPQAHMVGVHVAAHDATTNLGCRVTANKLAWIRRVAADWSQSLTFSMGRYARSLSAVDEDSGYDIGGPIPDDAATTAQGWYGARSLTLTAPEYPMASRFEAAASGNFRAVSGTRTIDRIVIHITDSGANISSPINWFKNPAAKVSAHYVIGQDGEIVQMVAHNDVAWHAGSANGTSIGIEHVANTKGLNPTPAQMCASAALVTWLCDQYGITPDRAHILGHAEADGKTTHKACPNAVWDWVYYMDMITTRTCYVPDSMTPRTQSLGYRNGYGRALDADGDSDDDAEEYGISEGEPEFFGGAAAQSYAARGYTARGLDAPQPDYPGADRFEPAHAKNFKVGRKAGAVVDRIVIHITAGGPSINGTIAWFKNGDRYNEKTGKYGYSSAHYIVGREGEVVQMVRNADTAYHASSANSRSIGIEHNANKPYSLNKRDLPLTEPQYEASARLVAWLCGQYGIRIDREHIIGHIEASPKDNHDCPTSYWDWDHYMQLVQAAANPQAAPPEVGTNAQSLGLRRPYAAAQEIITPYYDPADPASALTCQADAFSQAREEWFAGVPNTTIFPHSAICLLEMNDGSGGIARGTGFYIGRNRILTCAHNLYNQASVVIIPGKNGKGGAETEPFGRTTVTSASWRIPASYAGSNDATDLAVIDNVPIDAPNGEWFDELEELNQSRPEGVVVCRYSSRSEKVPELTKAIDGFKQHLHAGYIAALAPDDSTFSYPILTLKRASGSPVYYISGKSGTLRSYVVGVHTGADSQDLNRGCRLMKNKIDWIEGRVASLSLGVGSRALGNDGPSDHPVHLIPQPNKDACWAASMAMLLAHRRQQSRTPESIINEVGGSLASSYGWELLNAARDHYGFRVIDQPSNASIYHAPKQWAEWLNTYGPLWVVIVGAPHAVVVAGIRGNLDDANATQVKILNPWDTRIAFDNDPIEFHPANNGYEDWLPFADFAADFGNMAQPDYGNWRILHLPVAAASAQSLSMRGNGGLRLASPPPSVRAFNLDAAGARREPIEPSRVLGAKMSRVIGEAGGSRWSLDQLEGMKPPATPSPSVSSAAAADVRIDINDWPAIEGAPTPLPLKIEFRVANGSLGDVRIAAGMPANLAYGVEVTAKIEDCADADGVARLRVRIDYRFRGLSQGNPDAYIEICLRGDGRHERENGWRDTSVEKPSLLNTAA